MLSFAYSIYYTNTNYVQVIKIKICSRIWKKMEATFATLIITGKEDTEDSHILKTEKNPNMEKEGGHEVPLPC